LPKQKNKKGEIIMGKNAIVGQSGGPTSVINASLAGVFESCKSRGADIVYGMCNGVAGLLEERVVDLSTVLTDDLDIELLKRTPSSFLGSCRYKLPDWHEDETVYKKLFAILEKLNIGYFFYIGGNDSMDTIGKLAEYGERIQSDIRFMGVPKTIDNDLMVTDHTPGYGSAAKYIATILKEVIRDSSVYDIRSVTVAEIMGRHAGWLAGSAALATWAGYGPDLIYLPETDFDLTDFLDDVHRVYDKTGKCMVAVSEGIHRADGTFISEAKTSATDGFGHAQLGGLAAMLADAVKLETGAKVRGIELSLLQRCGSHTASKTDIDEAFLAGKAAVEAAVSGITDKMVAFRCTREGGYTCQTSLEPLEIVANAEKKVPREWINAVGNGVEQPFIDYVLPLIQGEPDAPRTNSLPRFAKLKKVLAH